MNTDSHHAEGAFFGEVDTSLSQHLLFQERNSSSSSSTPSESGSYLSNGFLDAFSDHINLFAPSHQHLSPSNHHGGEMEKPSAKGVDTKVQMHHFPSSHPIHINITSSSSSSNSNHEQIPRHGVTQSVIPMSNSLPSGVSFISTASRPRSHMRSRSYSVSPSPLTMMTPSSPTLFMHNSNSNSNNNNNVQGWNEEIVAGGRTRSDSVDSFSSVTSTNSSNSAIGNRRKRSSSMQRRTGPVRRSKKGGWTDEEDEILRQAVQAHKGKTWKKISECVPGRTSVQCLHRWQKVLNPNLIKGPWSKEEDEMITGLVARMGAENWSLIATHMEGRIGKQCRERWFNHLSPDVRRDPWTPEEEQVLLDAQSRLGNKWSEISKIIPGRTDNSCKNHFNSLTARIRRKEIGASDAAAAAAATTTTTNTTANTTTTPVKVNTTVATPTTDTGSTTSSSNSNSSNTTVASDNLNTSIPSIEKRPLRSRRTSMKRDNPRRTGHHRSVSDSAMLYHFTIEQQKLQQQQQHQQQQQQHQQQQQQQQQQKNQQQQYTADIPTFNASQLAPLIPNTIQHVSIEHGRDPNDFSMTDPIIDDNPMQNISNDTSHIPLRSMEEENSEFNLFLTPPPLESEMAMDMEIKQEGSIDDLFDPPLHSQLTDNIVRPLFPGHTRHSSMIEFPFYEPPSPSPSLPPPPVSSDFNSLFDRQPSTGSLFDIESYQPVGLFQDEMVDELAIDPKTTVIPLHAVSKTMQRVKRNQHNRSVSFDASIFSKPPSQ